MKSVLTEFNQSRFEFDRIATDTFNFPFNLIDIELQPNELAVASTINLKLSRLYDNFLYLYGLCSIANFLIPKTFTGWVGVSSRNPTVTYNTSTSYASTSSFLVDKNYRGIYSSSKAASYFYENKNNVVVADQTNLTIFSIGKDNSLTFVKTQSLIDPLSGTLYFQNIAGVATDENKTLYVLDKNLANLYSYDLQQATGDDYVFSQRLFLKDSIGGQGGPYDLLKFNYPNNLLFTGSELIVEDSKNKTFKVYDKNLNFLGLTVMKTLFDTVTSFNCLAYDKANKKIYGATNQKLYILNFNTDYTVTSSQDINLTNYLDSNEQIMDLKFSNYESNIFYLLTNKNIIKKWTTKLNYNIGIFPSSTLSNYSLKWITTTQYTLSSDQILIYNQDLNSTKDYIAVFDDDIDLITILKDLDFNIYDLNDIKIKEEEYVQSWVFNKSLKKLLYNHLFFNTYIGYRFFEGLDSRNTPVFVKRGYSKLMFNRLDVDVNKFVAVGVNENFQSNVINRCLRKIYEYQLYLLINIISNETVLERLVEVGGGFSKVGNLTYVNYTAGLGITLNPGPDVSLLFNSDALINALNDIQIAGLAPYIEAEGISINEV